MRVIVQSVPMVTVQIPRAVFIRGIADQQPLGPGGDDLVQHREHSDFQIGDPERGSHDRRSDRIRPATLAQEQDRERERCR